MRHTIIIVDDVEETREELQVVLESDFEILGKAASVRDGISLIQATGPDLVLVDLILPGVSGFELLKYVAESRPPRPLVIVLSGTGTSECVSRALSLGAKEFFIKPAKWDLNSQQKLRAVITDVLTENQSSAATV